MPHSAPNSVALLIGVTGHQVIASAIIPALKRAIREVFRDLQRDYPNTPLVLLSPLAVGADQLVADVALESGVQLVAVLPWSREIDAVVGTQYDERGSCERLLTRAAQVVAMPLAQGVSAEGLRADESARHSQFDQCGRYIARHSQVLIALWDADDSTGSHTAKVVRYHAEGAPAPFAARVGELDTAEQAAVCTLRVQRGMASTPDASSTTSEPATQATSPIRPEWSYPQVAEARVVRKRPKTPAQWAGWLVRSALLIAHRLMHVSGWRSHGVANVGERQLRQRWRAADRFNRDIGPLRERAAAALATSRGYLIPDAEVSQLSSCIQQLRDTYALADMAAGEWQSRTWRTVLALFAAGLLAVASLETYAHLAHQWYWLAAYLFLLGCGYALFRWTERREQQGRWLDYRALSEALRVQVFWRAAGLTDCVADHYLRHFRGELDWTRHAARSAYLLSGGHATTSSVAGRTAEDFALIQKHWIADQQTFFTGKGPHNAELAICFETGARLAFWSAVVVAAWHLCQHVATHHMSHPLVLGTFGCLVAAALLDEFAEIHAYALLARRYAWMAELYRNAQDRFAALLASEPLTDENVERIQRLMFELGLEALAENADWVVQHRERPPILPSG